MSTRFQYFNLRSHDVTVVIEPWADVELLKSGERAEFVLEGDNAHIETSDDGEEFLVFAWANTVTFNSPRRAEFWSLPKDYLDGPSFMAWHGPPWKVTKNAESE